jgi:hypothetical protein
VEGAAAPLRDQVVARLQLKLVDDVRPARGQRAGAAVAADIGAAGGAAGDVDQHDGEVMLAEGLRQGCRMGHDVRNRNGDDSLLQVDDDEGGRGVESGQRHGFCSSGI